MTSRSLHMRYTKGAHEMFTAVQQKLKQLEGGAPPEVRACVDARAEDLSSAAQRV